MPFTVKRWVRPPERVTVTRSPTCTVWSDDPYVDAWVIPAPAIPMPSTISSLTPGLRNDPSITVLGVVNVLAYDVGSIARTGHELVWLPKLIWLPASDVSVAATTP